MGKKYNEPIEKDYDFDQVIEEAGRCLLCLDAPCSKDCPAKTNPGSFIRSARFQNFKGGAETIRRNNALGAICALVCPTEKYCQLHCPRADIDRPIDIGKIQAFLTDFEEKTGMRVLERGVSKGKSVAIIGSGPGGLQAAATLLQLGYDVTIYEKDQKPGGVLRYGIPEYRLPTKVLDAEIKRIVDLGAKIVVKTEIGKHLAFNDIRGIYDAIILAIGFSKGKNLEQFNEHPDVEIAIDFLKEIKENPEKVKLPNNVLVIGGGDVAMDVCSTLKLHEVPNVSCAIYETKEELRASKKELETAQTLGTTFLYGYVTTEVKGNEIIMAHRNMDAKIMIKPDKVILAVGQKIAFDGFEKYDGNYNEQTMTTNDPKVFITGDLGEGDKTVVWAVRKGKMVANIVDDYLNGGK